MSQSVESITPRILEDNSTQTEDRVWTELEETVIQQGNLRDIRIKQLTDSIQDLLGRV
jgi:hypothetical protein